jgi:hypothetical protein
MHTVEFITLEDEDPDLIVSFALAPQAAHSITLIRTPKFESLLSEEDRGVAVGAGVHGTDDRELLVEIQINTKRGVGSIVSTKRTYELLLSRVEAEDLKATVALLHRMNFDSRFLINAA